MLPHPIGADMPAVYGVSPSYAVIGNLRVASGRFFDEAETTAAAPVAVLGEAAAAALFGADDPVGRYVKVNEQWFQVIGVAGPQLTVQTDVAGLPAQDRNNLIYVPLYSSIFRLEDSQSARRDEIDGIYLQLRSSGDVPAAAALVRGILDVVASRRRRLHDRRRPRSCSPSSGGPSGSSRWSWWRSRRSRCWSAASAS